MGDALELGCRLPELWRMVGDLTVPVHVARHAAEHTRDLAPEAAAHADRLLTRAAARRQLTPRTVNALIDEARLYHDPDRAIDDEHHALAARKVQLTPGQTPATTDVVMTLDTPDAVAFDAAVSRGAAALHALGDDDRSRYDGPAPSASWPTHNAPSTSSPAPTQAPPCRPSRPRPSTST